MLLALGHYSRRRSRSHLLTRYPDYYACSNGLTESARLMKDGHGLIIRDTVLA